MPPVYSIDLHSWLKVMGILDAGGNPYRETDLLNWPPFWMQFLFAIKQIAKLTGLSPITGVQAVLIGCETVNLGIVYFLSAKLFPDKNAFPALLWGLALNPVCIFLSCMHCNYDVFVGLWVLLAVWMLIVYSRDRAPDAWLMACFFLGMGILTKTVPAILAPLLLVGIRALPIRTILFGALLLAAPFAIGMSVLFALEPHGVMSHVIGYRSIAGWYGITGLMWTVGIPEGIAYYKLLSPVLFLGLILASAWLCFRRRALSAGQIITAASLLMLAIPTFGPGYSPPYILWVLPVALLLFVNADEPLRRLLAAGWIITILTYTVEYALLGDHGAFLLAMLPPGALPDNIGSRVMQTLTRLPMFAFYILLIRSLYLSLKRQDEASERSIAR